MARYDCLSKSVSEEEKTEILRELRELNHVKQVELTEGESRMKVETKDGSFQDVMNGAVNICRRLAGGCELSFAGFSIR